MLRVVKNNKSCFITFILTSITYLFSTTNTEFCIFEFMICLLMVGRCIDHHTILAEYSFMGHKWIHLSTQEVCVIKILTINRGLSIYRVEKA